MNINTHRTQIRKTVGVRFLITAVLTVGAVMLVPRPALAIPTLQLYIEGSTYDASTESWTFTGDDFRLWVLGDVGAFGTVSAVKLAAAYPVGLTGTITLTPALADPALLPSPDDPSLPLVPTLVANPSSALSASGACGNNGTVGTIPCMGNGKSVAQHGEYGTGTQWKEYLLGDLTLQDSPIGDYISAPPSSFPHNGQINAYDVSVQGFPQGTEIHFDAFDHIVQTNGKLKYVFAPFSHDVIDAPASVPEPSGLLFTGSVLGSLLGGAWIRYRSK